ncbi:NAD(P)-dependent oxidoreductase [Hymenobacter sp. BT770]|uniref:SDR family oxidoreductase n=1 Tax=Hymenobacter sp. BT770 TaxID=2886942 RepID=UPI001D11D56C|nr:NAD(P)-dependent oxidoreductase [Hymenobacter sp. BT770]MCC3153811.1 NAD(P)-dependent oxidoreductase [Hymenobacter sp. BT770]MDO3415955.1 NAD(P)-dependent oxidoreductase [Hymenobacter sp. BT770]
MNILIVGASGLVGSNCQAYLSQFDEFAVLGTHLSFETTNSVYFNSCDLADTQNASLDEFGPEVIVHCGALTFVDYCESHPEESHLKTVVSTQNLLAAARRHNSKFIFISTDYVFDGEQGPYAEGHPVNPICVYGAHKLAAEQLVVNSGLAYLILRITNVYGDELRGKNFIARMLNQIAASEPIALTLPHDQYATPINARDVAKAIKVLLNGKKQGLYHLGSTDYMNRFQLAERVIHKFAYEKAALTLTNTQALAQAAARPLNGGLLARKFLSEFPDFRFTNVDDYLTTKLHA